MSWFSNLFRKAKPSIKAIINALMPILGDLGRAALTTVMDVQLNHPDWSGFRKRDAVFTMLKQAFKDAQPMLINLAIELAVNSMKLKL